MLGSSGSGKSTLINRAIKKDRCEISHFHFESAFHRVDDEIVVINDNKYCCTFLEPFGISDISHREVHLLPQLGKLNLIVFVLKLGSSCNEVYEASQRLTNFIRDASSISALVITGCEYLSDDKRMKLVDDFKSGAHSKDFAARMGKGIYTVGFPDITGGDFPHEGKEYFESVALKDVAKLHELIRGSSDVKAVENCSSFMFT